MLATETDVVLPAASLQQLRSELSALIIATAQIAWTAASQFAVQTARKSEAREASPSGYVSERRSAIRHGPKAPTPPAHFSNPAAAPLNSLDVGRFRRELDGLRSYMNHTAFDRDADNGSAPQTMSTTANLRNSASSQSAELRARRSDERGAIAGKKARHIPRLLKSACLRAAMRLPLNAEGR